MALLQLNPEVGMEVGGVRVNHGAFVDGIALYAATPPGLQVLAVYLDHQLGLCGLEISTGLAGKSASLRNDIDGRAKKWVVNPLPHLLVGGGATTSSGFRQPSLSVPGCGHLTTKYQGKCYEEP